MPLHTPRRTPLRPACLLLAGGLALFAQTGLLGALPPLTAYESWPRAQELSVKPAGLARIDLPAATLDQLSTDFSDLRLVGDEGAEIPWTVLLPHAPRSAEVLVSAPMVRLDERATVVRFSPPKPSSAVVSLILGTSAARLNKPLSLEGSDDGVSWTLLLDKVPVYRLGPDQPVSQVRLSPARFAHYRLTLGDRSSPPVPVTSLSLGIQAVDTTPSSPGGVSVVRREEVAGESRLTLRFDGRGAFLSELGLQVSDPAFSRPLRLVERRFSGDRIEELVLVRGQILRVPPESGDSACLEPGRLSVERPLPWRELVLVIENGDSPPLNLTELRASYRPLQLLFPSPASGHCALLAGARQVSRPSYDLAALSERLSASSAPLPGQPADFSGFSPNPDFRASDRLPEFPLLGATLDRAAWSGSREVSVSTPGVQQLDLDPALLASSPPNYADLRLVNGASQVPFLIEYCSFSRVLPLELKPADSGRPGVSRWSLHFPVARLPLQSLVIATQSPVFERTFELFEERRDSRGESRRFTIGEGTWSRRSPSDSARFALRVYQTPLSDTLLLETSDGDNLPISLDRAELRLPVVRLHFKTADTTTLSLLSGNPRASAPSYDLRLVAAQLLSAPPSEAMLAPATPAKPAPDSLLISLSRQSSVLFWAVLILVAVSLLLIIARLLPKNGK